MKAVILAAGIGSRLAPLTNDRPKVLVEILGRSFLHRQMDALAKVGITGSDVVVVGGYRLDKLRAALEGTGATIVVNEKFEPWNNFHSLLVAEPAVRGSDFLQLDGDVILDEELLPKLVAGVGDIVLAVDCRDTIGDEEMKAQVQPGTTRVIALSKKLDPKQCVGESLGLSKVSARVAPMLFEDLAKLPGENLTNEYYEYSYNRLSQQERLRLEMVDVHGCKTIEIDTVEDLRAAEEMMRRA